MTGSSNKITTQSENRNWLSKLKRSWYFDANVTHRLYVSNKPFKNSLYANFFNRLFLIKHRLDVLKKSENRNTVT
jgi:hypothetical protein